MFNFIFFPLDRTNGSYIQCINELDVNIANLFLL